MIVDLSCYIPSDMKTSMLGLENIKIGVYVYISTDSVYEVTQAKYVEEEIDSDESYETNDSFKSFHSYSSSSSSDSIDYTIERREDAELLKNQDYYTEEGLIKEGYGFYSKHSDRFRTYLCRLDAYGFEKLQCEYVLKKYCGDGRRYLILRLPDVIGPYDESDRFWVVVIRMLALVEFLKKDDKDAVEALKFEFDKEEIDKPLSFVSSTDVSKILTIVLSNLSSKICRFF